MKSLFIWLQAARLKTLPLAAGGILLGSFLAAYDYSFSWLTFFLALTTALMLQILSNLANDYGDFVKGTDQTAQRKDRALTSGVISIKTMKKAIWIVVILSLVLGLSLLWAAIDKINVQFLFMFTLGLMAIAAAIKYTIGKNAYGYFGLGDMLVLLFFGPVAVCGLYFLMTLNIPDTLWMPAIAYGLLCTSVLNINNIRDIESDTLSHKKTIALRLGYKKAIWYHYAIIGTAMVLFILFARVTVSAYDQFVSIVFGGLYYWTSLKIEKKSTDRAVYDKALKNISILNLVFVIILGIFWLAG